jgi:hypothetical protein
VTFFLVFLCLPVAAGRLTRLIVKDTLPPVLWARDRLVGGWRPPTEAEWRTIRAKGKNPWTITDHNGAMLRWVDRAPWVPDWLAELISCPWCASAYVSAVATVYGAALDWYSWPQAVVIWLYTWGIAAVYAVKEWS